MGRYRPLHGGSRDSVEWPPGADSTHQRADAAGCRGALRGIRLGAAGCRWVTRRRRAIPCSAPRAFSRTATSKSPTTMRSRITWSAGVDSCARIFRAAMCAGTFAAPVHHDRAAHAVGGYWGTVVWIMLTALGSMFVWRAGTSLQAMSARHGLVSRRQSSPLRQCYTEHWFIRIRLAE